MTKNPNAYNGNVTKPLWIVPQFSQTNPRWRTAATLNFVKW